MGDVAFIADRMTQSFPLGGATVLIVAGATEVERLADAIGGSDLADMSLVAIEVDRQLAPALLDQRKLLILEVDPSSASCMGRLAQVRESHPDLIIVAAIRNATVALVRTLVRQGVADVVALPLDPKEIVQVSLHAIAQRGFENQRAKACAPLLSVVRSIGGCGATTIATHLAAALGTNDKSALIVDLDVQFGTVADYLGVSPHGRLNDLLEAHDRLDDDLLRSVASRISDRLSVVAAPEAIMSLEQINTDHLLKVINLLRRQYGFVIIDLPSNWTDWTLSIAAASQAIVMVVELSLSSLRQAKRRLELFRSVGIERRAIQVVVNRAEKRIFNSIDLGDVAKTLGHPVLGSVVLDQALVGSAQNQGQLVNDLRAKSRFGADVSRIAELLRSGPLGKVA